jgi:hypothetical protein
MPMCRGHVPRIPFVVRTWFGADGYCIKVDATDNRMRTAEIGIGEAAGDNTGCDVM